MITFLVVALVSLAAVASAALAQQPQQQTCKKLYQLGETIPPTCRDGADIPAWWKWGEGYGAARNAPAVPVPPPGQWDRLRVFR